MYKIVLLSLPRCQLRIFTIQVYFMCALREKYQRTTGKTETSFYVAITGTIRSTIINFDVVVRGACQFSSPRKRIISRCRSVCKKKKLVSTVSSVISRKG